MSNASLFENANSNNDGDEKEIDRGKTFSYANVNWKVRAIGFLVRRVYFWVICKSVKDWCWYTDVSANWE